MPQIYRKICLECLREFESPGSKNCLYCGSNRWNFINEQGGVEIPYRRLLDKLSREGKFRAFMSG